MFAADAGNLSAEPVLLIHGFLSSNAQWDLNVDDLGVDHWLVMAELMGHGESPAPDDPAAYSGERLIAEFERMRVERSIEQWWVCGQSLGGALAILYCLAHPDRVKGLIFTNSRAAFGIGRRGVSREPGTPAPPPIASTRDLPIHPINATRLAPAIKQRMVDAADKIPVHVVDHYTARRHTWRAVDRFSELKMPVLLVNGRWESAFQPHAERVHELFGNIEVVDVEGGHAINAEQPEAFNGAVRAFIEKNVGA